MDVMEIFLGDYERGKESERYINSSLSELLFEDREFDLALYLHYLFLYNEYVNLEQYLLSKHELCRVAKEVRVYPLFSLN